MSKVAGLLIVSLVLAVPAIAHPGHGVPGQGWSLAHYLTEPVHVLSGFVLVLLFIASVRAVGRRWWRTRP